MKSLRNPIANPVVILLLLSVGYAMSFFHRVCPSVLAVDLTRDLSLDATSFGLIGSATMLGYAVTQLPTGVLADIIGARRTISLYQIISGGLCVLFALCDGLTPAVGVRFFMGITLAANVPAYKILAASASANRYAMYCSILTGFGTIGSLLASTPLAFVSGLVGWRASLIAAGLFTVMLGATVFAVVPDSDLSSAGENNLRENVARLRKGLCEVVRSRNFWLIFIWFMLTVSNLFTLVTGWLGGFLMEADGFSKDDAGLCLSIMAVLPLCCLPVCPWLSDNVFHSRRIFLLLGALIQTAVLGFLCFSGKTHFSLAEMSVATVMFNITSMCMGPLSFTMVKESVPASALASACGFINSGAPVLSAMIQGIVGSSITSRMAAGATPMEAYSTAFIPLFVCAALAAVVALFMKDTFNKEK